MNNPAVSIIICTRNRACQLAPTLSSVIASTHASKLATELIVVDNGSSDETSDVVRSATEDWGSDGIVYLVVPEPGQCRARNAGISRSRGQALLWTDDDVRVTECWVDELALPLLANEADCVIGGWTTAPHLNPLISALDAMGFSRGMETSSYLKVETDPLPVGMNMSFHRRVLRDVPEFDINLGPGVTGYGDDSLFGLRMRAAGYRFMLKEHLRVEHHMDPSRLTPEGMLRAAKLGGMSAAYIDYHFNGKPAPKLRLHAGRFKRWLLSLGSRALRRWSTRDQAAFLYDQSYTSQMLKESHEAPRYFGRGCRDGR
jgi:glucosyl-dolichyl phosphate glucuronosyltransferase